MRCKNLRKMEGGVWGMVIIFSAFMIQFIAFGISGSIGVYNVEFLEHFDTEALDVSLISSINLGVFLGTGPLASYLMDRFSHRKVVICGGLMSSLGIISMPWLPNIYYMYLAFGVINGLGGCLSYVPSHVLSGLYYDEKRGLATGIATAGSGLGITVGPIVIAYLIDEFTWKGSLIILTGVSLNIIVFGALLRPVPYKEITKTIPDPPIPSVSANIADVVENGTLNKLDVKVVISDVENNVTKELPVALVGSQDEIQVQIVSRDRNGSPTKSDAEKLSYFRKLVKHILTNVDFMVYFVNNIFWNMGLAIVLALLAEYCVQQGISKIDSAFIVTINGLGGFTGCIAGGIFSNIKKLHSIYTFGVMNILAGIALFLLPLFSGFGIYVMLSFLNGFFIGVILGYLLAILADILGPEYFGDGVGVIMISNGMGAFLGPSVAGSLEEGYGLGVGIILGGASCVVGGAVIFIIPLRNRYSVKTRPIESEIVVTADSISLDQPRHSTSYSLSPDNGSNVYPPRKNSFYKEVSLENERNSLSPGYESVENPSRKNSFYEEVDMENKRNSLSPDYGSVSNPPRKNSFYKEVSLEDEG